MESNVALYHFPGSLCSQKVRLALAEKRVPYQKRFVDIEMRLTNFEPWYLGLNPRGVVPTLVHRDRVVTDSARIIHYIDEAFEGPPLVPVAIDERESMEKWVGAQDHLQMRELSYASFKGGLGFMLRKVSMPLRRRKLRRMRDANPDLVELYEAKIKDLNQWRASIASRAEIAEIRSDLANVLRRANDQLGKTRFLAGDTYSLADLAWTCIFARLKMLGLEASLWGEGQLPHVQTYYENLRMRPSFAEADIWEAGPSPEARRAILKSLLPGGRRAADEKRTVEAGS